MALKKAHKIGIITVLAIIVITSALFVTGLIIIHHHYNMQKGSPDMPQGDSAPNDNGSLNDAVSIHKTTFIFKSNGVLI